MDAKAIFSDKTGFCRLEILHAAGDLLKVWFEHVSSMLNYCHEVGIDVHEVSCETE